jgi:hypothetical protein
MRRAVLNGVSPRSIITSPKPPLCKSKSVTRNACSTGFSIFSFFSGFLCLRGEPDCCNRIPHRTQSIFSKSTPATAAERGLKASLISTRAHASCRWVAAARVANSTLVRPDEAGPQISVRHPRGSPPVSTSIAWTPLETICGMGRTSNREAGVTPASLGIADKRWQTSVDQTGAATATKRPGAAVETSGKVDMETSGFQGTSGPAQALGRIFIFAFYSLLLLPCRAEVVKHF